MSSIYFSLNQDVESHKFLKAVQELIAKYGNVSNCILKIEIIEITREYNDIPKLEEICVKVL